MTYKGAGSVIKIQFQNPIFTKEGACTIFNKYLTTIHIAICGTFCVLTTFTDSYIALALQPGLVYGFEDSLDLSSYKLRLADFVHPFSALIAFGVLALLDSNTGKANTKGKKKKEKKLAVEKHVRISI
ncbi:hypothetical protein FEM48_Zijuj07G0137800 [Ziziphus jujuba var. spinosa]|uniref:Uncharacterized protein n=1 Tax=Ziziphus jujuba var. spinosa TaxID=714518 RepID=A0A978V4Z9_ZIZJJ|nr:hypothetical protein FEM48_Zijuj07G0137800 [Ziziphus jujuba var. spinosa]